MKTGPQGWTSGYGQKGWKNQSYFDSGQGNPGGGGSPLSAMGLDSFGQQASRNIPGGFGNPSYGSGMGGPVWQNPSSGTNWNYMTGQQNLPY